jgi:hypothetical protein
VVFGRYKKPNGFVDSRSTNQYSLWVIFILFSRVLWAWAIVVSGPYRGSRADLNAGTVQLRRVCSSVSVACAVGGPKHELWHLAHSCTHINAIETVIRDVSLPRQTNNFYLMMLHINPKAVPFALTADNKVPLSNRDNIFWDESGDVLLVTKDKIAVLFQKTLLLQYSETARSALGHIAEQPEYDRWMPTLELACNAAELRDVLEYLQSQKQYVLLLSIRLGQLFK